MKLGIDHLAGQAKRRTAVNKLCEELRQAIAKCMDDTRTIANDLRPVALDSFGIGAVITQHARHFAARSNLNIRVVEGEVIPPQTDSVRLLLFRAAQEALTNVAKHAHAATVQISLEADADRITLTVADDGVGIATGSLRKPQSLGLLGLRERVEALGGELTVTRNSPSGTRLTLQLPHDAVISGALT
jgi:signal transduction histidine kinase